MEALTKQEKKFVKEVVETGNKTQSVIKAFPETKSEKYASVKGQRLIGKDRIKNAIKTVADSLPDKKLIEVHLEGLEAGKRVFKNNNETGEIEDMGVEPDYAVRHKYLDSAYKIKNYYPKEGNTTAIQVNINKFKDYE